MNLNNYKKIHELMMRRGGSNQDGRISRNFFPEKPGVKETSLQADIPRNFQLPGTNDLSSVYGANIDIIAGCELSYASEYLKKLGFTVRHSFEMHRAMEPYGELIDPKSIFHSGDAEAIIYSQTQVIRPLLHQIEIEGGRQTKDRLSEILSSLMEALEWSILEIRKNRSLPIWIFTHPGYHTPALGIHDYRIPEGYWTSNEFLTYYKMAVYELTRKFNSLYVLDTDLALEREGKAPQQRSTRIRLHETMGGHPEKIGAEILAENFIHQLMVINKKLKRIKLVVVDCDNTLWTGILREDGVENIKINRHRFQRLWHLSLRGIPVAICSKNDPSDEELILKVINSYGKLGASIVATRINWQPKSTNIISIADELNIGIDTIAFFDDSAFERAEVEDAIPNIFVFDEKAINWAPEYPAFHPMGDLSDEAFTRVQKYKEASIRQASEKSFGDDRFEDFLYSCEMRIDLRIAKSEEINRIFEIIQRTNQMNATLQRFSKEVCASYIKGDQGKCAHIIKLGDKFGDYGLIGVCLSKVNDTVLHINELTLSCRAMGRRVEDALLEEIIGYAADQKLKKINIEVTNTARNAQIMEVLDRVGFKLEPHENDNSAQKTLSIDLSQSKRTGRQFAEWFNYDPEIADDD